AEGVAAVAAPRLGRVVDLAPLVGRQLRFGTPFEHLNLPAELFRVVGVLVGLVRAGEDPGPGFRVQDVVHGRRRTVVEVRRRRPAATGRRRLVTRAGLRAVAVAEPAALLVAEPAGVVVTRELVRNPLVALGVGADLFEGDDAVGVGPLLAVSAVAAGAGLLEE